MRAQAQPFNGKPPNVKAGDAVEIRDYDGNWHATTAHSEARYDFSQAFGVGCWLTVAVDWGDGTIVNWPAEDVRLVPVEDR